MNAPAEAKLFRRALERASFIDTPVGEQERIQEFCARALEGLGEAEAEAESAKAP